MKTYYIYHIPGKKIGCTTNPDYRIKTEQGFIYYEILETHSDIQIASNREKELQEQYNYPTDKCNYITSVNNRYKWGDPDDQKLFSSRVKNRYEWKSGDAKIAGKKGSDIAWTNNRERMFETARENVKKATEAAAKSENRASLKEYFCTECNRKVIGAGPAAIHAKKSGHNVNKT